MQISLDKRDMSSDAPSSPLLPVCHLLKKFPNKLEHDYIHTHPQIIDFFFLSTVELVEKSKLSTKPVFFNYSKESSKSSKF